MKLRASQIELLRAVERHEDDVERGYGAAPATLAGTLDRKRDSVEESLAKLEEAGYVRAIFRPLLSVVYVLTDQGIEKKWDCDGGWS